VIRVQLTCTEPKQLNCCTIDDVHHRVSPDLSAIVRLGVLAFDDLIIREHAPELDAAFASAEAALRARAPEPSGAVRTMYKRIGLDPTKRRPSSEALLRRVLKGDPLPRINALVDVCNWCSAEFQLPYGLYDRDRIDGDVQLRLGVEGESYAGIRKDDVHVGGRITLADRVGPFGNPTSDSARTMITPAAMRALMIVYSPADVAAPVLEGVLDVSSARSIEFCGGREVMRRIVYSAIRRPRGRRCRAVREPTALAGHDQAVPRAGAGPGST
jgi:DNA/RNA-binding domain of Phe-tRNA-synthetase-like protein